MVNFTSSYESILFINADPIFCRVIRFYLEDCGFKVYDVQNADEALKYYTRIKPDLIISDIHVRASNGLDLIDYFKEKSPQTPIIVMSEESEKEEVVTALKSGAWNYIFKPIKNMAILEHSVCRALEHSRLLKENEIHRSEIEKKNIEIIQNLEQLKDNHKIGKSVQQLLLPKPYIQYRDLMISHKLIPYINISGDFVDYFTVDKNHIGFYIAEVSGHSASSGFITIFLKDRIEQVLAKYYENENEIVLHPELVLDYINREIFDIQLGKPLTMIYCVLDQKNSLLRYSIAGHHPNPVLWDNKKASFLSGHGTAIGVRQNAKYEAYCCELPLQFSVGLFSDGVLNALKEERGIKTDDEVLLLFNNLEPNVDEILTTVRTLINTKLNDDIAMLLMSKDPRVTGQARTVNIN